MYYNNPQLIKISSLFISDAAHLSIEMNADVRAHVLRADLQHAVLVDAARVGPLRDDVVDDPLAQVLRHRVLTGVQVCTWASRTFPSFQEVLKAKVELNTRRPAVFTQPRAISVI